MTRNAIILAIAIGAAAIIGGGVLIWQFLASDPDAPGATPTPARTAEIDEGEPDDILPIDPTGGTAGDYDPLRVPGGVTSGIGADIPDSELTQPGTALVPGDIIVAYLHQAEATANPYVLLTVDEITDPLSGAEREAAYATAGATDDGTQVVQRVTIRVRQIAGGADTAAWNLARSVYPVNLKLETMTVVPTGGPDCASPSAPLGAGDTADTVRSCFYAFGAVNTPTSIISSITVEALFTDATKKLYIQSDKNEDLQLEESHDHSDHAWQIDTETGLPIIDPETGMPVPAEEDDHDHDDDH